MEQEDAYDRTQAHQQQARDRGGAMPQLRRGERPPHPDRTQRQKDSEDHHLDAMQQHLRDAAHRVFLAALPTAHADHRRGNHHDAVVGGFGTDQQRAHPDVPDEQADPKRGEQEHQPQHKVVGPQLLSVRQGLGSTASGHRVRRSRTLAMRGQDGLGPGLAAGAHIINDHAEVL